MLDANTKKVKITQVFELYSTDVYRFALSITHETYLAQDVTQEVFLSLLQNDGKIRDDSKIKAWLLTVTRNTALNILRKRSFETSLPDMPLTETNTGACQSEFLSLIDCLEETDRQIVVLHIVNGLKHKEIAAITSMRPGTVQQRYARCVKIIKQNL